MLVVLSVVSVIFTIEVFWLTQGERINNAITESEIIVHVGTMRCDVTFIEETGLGCILPEELPPAGDFNGQDTKRGLPVVRVSLKTALGRTLRP